MAKINVLDKQVAELIAAGEVVERPASIVKELVENAIDAQADVVTVEIQGGGVRLIRVTDNGSGIVREDVPLAFLRHATSKVRVREDLAGISTMGFRGEALASIAAMCRVEVLTRTADEVAGTRFLISGGEQEKLEDAGCPVGTTIIVRDVFYNTPARMKFLKKDVSEGNSVFSVVEKAALAHPEIAFKFIRDGVVKLQTPGDGQLLSAIRSMLGRDFAQNMIEVDYEHDGMRVRGYIGKPSIARASRSLQNFFINTRFVRSKTCMAALEEAYRNLLMVGRYPSCVLDVTIPPQLVDVNVHPAKIEVRFADERSIFSLVYYGCKTALGAGALSSVTHAVSQKQTAFAAQKSTDIPEQQKLTDLEYHRADTLASKVQTTQSAEPIAAVSVIEPLQRPRINIDIAYTPPKEAQIRADGNAYHSPQAQTRTPPVLPETPLVVESASFLEETPQPLPEPARQQTAAQSTLYENARVVGELFDTYIVLQSGSEMVLVDKHAAHERLLYNRLVSGGVGEEKQVLLDPITVKLSPSEYAAAVENLDLLSQAGIGAEDFGDGYLIVREAAPVLSGCDLEGVVAEFANKLQNGNSRLFSQQLEEIYHTMACRAAIKAHDKTPAPSIEQLIALLREDADATHCPHGRPVALRMTQHEIDKRFGRLG